MKILKTAILFLFCIFILTSCDRIKLVVENGSGSGSYASNGKVLIRANLPMPGYEFDKWQGQTSGIEDLISKETYIVLPEMEDDEIIEIRVKATFIVDPSSYLFDSGD